MMTGQDRKKEGRQHGALIGGIVADVGQRTIVDPGIEDAADLQEVDEEGQLPMECSPPQPDPTRRGYGPKDVHRHRLLGLQGLALRFTHTVSSPGSSKSPQTGVGISLGRLESEVNCVLG